MVTNDALGTKSPNSTPMIKPVKIFRISGKSAYALKIFFINFLLFNVVVIVYNKKREKARKKSQKALFYENGFLFFRTVYNRQPKMPQEITSPSPTVANKYQKPSFTP